MENCPESEYQSASGPVTHADTTRLLITFPTIANETVDTPGPKWSTEGVKVMPGAAKCRSTPLGVGYVMETEVACDVSPIANWRLLGNMNCPVKWISDEKKEQESVLGCISIVCSE